ncbi:hypothetical protein PYW07_014569 [Mythimna separata]|uniref:Uncharacterized protein n=1 Tax=Mythimna separata TaxID=271217 RepID=A0AAD8DZM3_MYTSE|nr:hypothetical protein PYW07_014569 [Mythimna separata]
MNSKRRDLFYLLYRGRRYVQVSGTTIEESASYVRSLSKHLNISESKAHYICMKHPVITKLNDEKISSLIHTINEMGFSNQSLIEEPALFGILPVTLKFRYKVLNECGIQNISSALLTTYLTILKQKKIGELKRLGYLPNHFNVENKLASFMTQWPTSLTTLIDEDVNYTSLYTLRLKIIQRYLELVLDLTREEFYRGVETYPTIKHRPLEYINETLQILQLQIMIPNHKIKSNLYLIHVDPENLDNIIHKFRSIGGIDIKEVIRMHPKLATRNCNSLFETRKILEEYGISNEAQRRCFSIYTLAPSTIRERLEQATKIPEFSAFIKHPRFLKMIHYNTTAMKRLNRLYNNNKKCVSLNVLSGSTAHYEAFEKAPGDRLGKGKDLLFCISQSLGKKFNMAKIRNCIKRHPFWINTPVLQVKYVYEQLSTQFADQDIYENCPILLYPWNKVKDTLNLIDKKLIEKQLPMFQENLHYDSLSKSQKLSLVLYLLEKNHYFSGNGVWTEEKYNDVDKLNYGKLVSK